MLRQALLGVIVLLATVAGPAYGQEVKLQFKFKEGDKFYVEDVSKTKETVAAVGVTQTTDNKVTTVTSYTIKKVTTDSTEVDMKIESVDIQSNSQDGLIGKIMGKMKSAAFTVTLAPDGKIKKFDGYKQWAKSVVGEDDDNAKFLGMLLSEDLFVNMVESGFAFLPDKSVKKGDTWSNDTRIPFSFMGELKSKNTYTYDGKEKDLDVIAIKQAMKYTPPKAGTEILGGLAKITRADLKVNNAHGKYFFDAAKGRLERVEMTMTVSGALTVDVGGQQQLDLTIVSNGTSRVLDTKPGKE
jgi:hypothetical protein